MSRLRSFGELEGEYLRQCHPKRRLAGVSVIGPCPICGGEDRFELRVGQKAAVIMHCRGGCSFETLLDGLGRGGSRERSKQTVDPWAGIARVSDLQGLYSHPALRWASELYAYRLGAAVVGVLEAKGFDERGEKRIRLYRQSPMGWVSGLERGYHYWVASLRLWIREKAPGPRAGRMYQFFESARPPLYRWHQVKREGVGSDQSVYLCAGPKDAEAGRLLGWSTTCLIGGESRQLPGWAIRELLVLERPIRIIYDVDEAGRAGARRAHVALAAAAKKLGGRRSGSGIGVVDLESLAASVGLPGVAAGFDLTDFVRLRLQHLEQEARRLGLDADASLEEVIAYRASGRRLSGAWSRRRGAA